MKAIFKAIVLASIASVAVFGQAIAAPAPHKTPATHAAAHDATTHNTAAKKHTATAHAASHRATTTHRSVAATHHTTPATHAKATRSTTHSVAANKRTHVPAHKAPVKSKS